MRRHLKQLRGLQSLNESTLREYQIERPSKDWNRTVEIIIYVLAKEIC